MKLIYLNCSTFWYSILFAYHIKKDESDFMNKKNVLSILFMIRLYVV